MCNRRRRLFAARRLERLESRLLLAANLSNPGIGDLGRAYAIEPAEFRQSWSPNTVGFETSLLAGATAAVFKPTLVGGTDVPPPTDPTVRPDSPPNRVDPNTPGGGRFAGVGSIKVEFQQADVMCTGAVIHQRFVLTAAHCFDVEVKPDGKIDADFQRATFILNDGGSETSAHVATTITTHPDFGGFSTSGANDDLAIMELATPVPDGTPIYALRSGEMSPGEELEIVGYGRAGFGDQGFTVMPAFDVKRIGRNDADLFAVDDEGSGTDEVYLFDFDEPTSTDAGFLGGLTLGNDIEATLGGGDSGGPAFVTVGNDPVIAGVNTFEFVLEGTTPPAGFFGSLGGGVIIGSYLPWVKSIVPPNGDLEATEIKPVHEPIASDPVEILEDETLSPPPKPAVLIGGSSWTVDFYSLSEAEATEDALPWINLDRIEVRYDAPPAQATFSLEGPDPGKLVPVSAVDELANTFVYSFPTLENGHYRLIVDQEVFMPAIDFTVLHGNLVGDQGLEAVAFADFVELARHFGQPLDTAAPARADLDGDGQVVFADFVGLVRNFGNTLPPDPVPAATGGGSAAVDAVFVLSDGEEDGVISAKPEFA